MPSGGWRRSRFTDGNRASREGEAPAEPKPTKTVARREPRPPTLHGCRMARRYSYTKSLRLRTRADFSAVYDAKTRETRGPLVIYARPNQLGRPRLGLSTSRKVG